MRIGIIGTGFIVDTMIGAVNLVEGVSCVGVFSRSEERGKSLAYRYKIAAYYTELTDMMEDSNIDTVYIASPNSLHFTQALLAISYGKHVICEKPFVPAVEQAKELFQRARDRGVFIFEAITTIHMPNYLRMKERITRLGDIKSIQCNYSKISSRYLAYLKGEMPNIFSLEFCGGALADLNIYNLHFIIGIFGRPREVFYYANKGYNGVDTSGIVILGYDNFYCEAVGGKDSDGPAFCVVQGMNGYLSLEGPPNCYDPISLVLGEEKEIIDLHKSPNRMTYELEVFRDIITLKDRSRFEALAKHSLLVVETAWRAREFAGIIFTNRI